MMPCRAYLLRLSWPDSALAPHAKGHWRPKATATKAARQEAHWAALALRLPCLPAARLAFRFHPPDNRRRDLHNMPSMLKGAIDGIADAMGCDDHGFRVVWPERFDAPITGGAVLVEVMG